MVKIERGPGLGGPKGVPTLVPSRSGSTQNMAANIRVVVRVRPLNDREKEQNNRIVVDVVDDKMLVFDPKEEMRPFFYQGVQQPNKNFLKRSNKELKFVFDHVCSQNSTNHDVFEIATKDMLNSLMEGYNCSVFVYGATGAGKTFTMIGNKEHPGITYLTMEHLFYTINSFEKDREFDIGVSYIEVYNENVYDLLKPSSTPLQLREDSKYGVMVAGLTLNNIKTARELLNMLENGNKNRTQHPTDANAESSRSHAVFQVYVKMRYKTSSQLRLVKLSMIDLAGSERASATGCVGERFKEGANINKSLLSLGNCINKLADGSSYIPYRDSKLTRLLKDSLGGNCKTVMIANVSPSSISYEDTYNTLKYAARANKIQLSIKKNIVDGDMRLSQYVKIVDELKKKVKELEAKLSLTSVKNVKVEPGVDKSKVQECRSRLSSAVSVHSSLQSCLLSLMSQARVLTLRRRMQSRAARRLEGFAHRSSNDAMHQVCTEDIPREERAAENFMKQSVCLDSKIMNAWTKWNESNKKINAMFEEAVTNYPELSDFVKYLQTEVKLQHSNIKSELRCKLLAIEAKENNVNTKYMSNMPHLLKKLYLTLKGYDKAPPALTAEYLDVMKKAKSAKGISWSGDSDTDPYFKFVSNLDLDKPATILDYMDDKDDLNSSVDATDCEDATDIENVEPKRRGTPLKLANDETIVINDSFDSSDVAKNVNPAKKIKREVHPVIDLENYAPLDANELNSTFVLAGKHEAWQTAPAKNEKEVQPAKKGLFDRTNTIQRTIVFNDNRVKTAKPVVGKALRVVRTGFGSGVARDGTPLDRQRNIQVGFKAVRARDRVNAHPYTRPNNGRK
ncbi:kinesin-like protein KIF18A isoform X2 [Danaus plexippus]|uniref:kinesin-like protein KIF18A isoform X2 n=1 Tax=Danaus plexippus TaxID=13037 RepID=UPI002AB07BD9|nr:kinesin-like protein KIF18A isoform X2 [Danaus plexippus]